MSQAGGTWLVGTARYLGKPYGGMFAVDDPALSPDQARRLHTHGQVLPPLYLVASAYVLMCAGSLRVVSARDRTDSQAGIIHSHERAKYK